jgi:hypothetical protein
MGNSNAGLKNTAFYANRISFPLALLLVITSFALSWIAFAVPDFLAFTTVFGFQSKFGLWNMCTLSLSYYSNGFSCSSWFNQPLTYPLPDFLKTTQVMITLGVVFTTYSMLVGLVAVFYRTNLFKLLPLLAGVCAFLACNFPFCVFLNKTKHFKISSKKVVFFLIGLSTFHGDYARYVQSVGGYDFYLRWAYHLLFFVLFLLFPAAFLFPIRTIHKYFLYKRDIENGDIRSRVLVI